MATSTAGSSDRKASPAGSSCFWRRPLDAGTIRIPRGDVHVSKERCKGCAFCVEYCPTSVLEMSPDFNSRGYHPPLARNPEQCVHCRLCEIVCPEFAIFVTLRPDGPSGSGGE